MIPAGNTKTVKILKASELSSDTYKLSSNSVGGNCAGLEAIKQAAYKILATERFQHVIYSWDYGVELQDLFGKPTTLVCMELEHRIAEALLQDKRIQSVSDFTFDCKRGVVNCTFKVHSTEGAFAMDKEVKI